MTSTDNPPPQIQVISSDGYSSDSNKTISDSFRTTKYEDLVRDSNLFQDKLLDFLGFTPTVPIVGGNRLDLHQLFVKVTTRGGLEKVIKERKCKEVIDTFALKSPITNASFVLKRYYYSKWLFKFEHVYYLKKPISSFAAREEELSGLLGRLAKRPRAGTVVNGIIEGKFDDGYFISVKMGSIELKGVIYHNSEEYLRRKKRIRRSRRSSVPFKPRSAYNFYYLENYERLKPRYIGTGKLLTKEIVIMWKNLSEADKKIYQEQAARDVERYNREMSEYRALMASHAAENVAATEAAATDTAIINEATDSEATDSDATESDGAMNDEEETDAETACEEAE